MILNTQQLESDIGYQFKDSELLKRALTHTSTITNRADSNECLEFFGDRVLGLCIAELLFKKFPDEREGDLGYRFTALVRSEALCRVGNKFELGQYIIMSQGEEETGGRNNPSLVSDACEALIAAIYLDGGLEQVAQFINTHWAELVNEDQKPRKDAKTNLQEWAQSLSKPLPTYQIIARTGLDHAPEFTVEVTVKGIPSASGSGLSKRAAEQDAATQMLDGIKIAKK